MNKFELFCPTWFWVADPYNLKQFLKSETESSVELETPQDGQTVPVDKHPLLDSQQEATLEKIGVDVEKLPTEITPEMEDCFRSKLGDERVNAIVSGEATAGALDFVRAGSCMGE